MRWLAQVVGSLAMLCIVVGCNASGAVSSSPPSWCLEWQDAPEGGYCETTESEAHRDYVDYVTRNVNEERRQDYVEYMDNPANHGVNYEDESNNHFNCDDLSSQDEAQAILESDKNDPNNLDGDHDGRACE